MEKVNRKREKGFNYYEELLILGFLMDRWECEKEPVGWGEASSRCWHLLDSQNLWASVEDFTLPVAFLLLPSLPFLLFMKICIWLQRWYSIVNVFGFPPRSLWISSYHFCAPSPFLVSVLTLGTYNSPSEDLPGGVGCPLPESIQSQTAVPFLLGQLLTNDWQVPEREKPSSLAQRFKEYIGVSLWEQVKAPLKGTSLEIAHVHGFLLFTAPLPRFPTRLPWMRFTINHLHSNTCLAVCFWGTQPKVSV